MVTADFDGNLLSVDGEPVHGYMAISSAIPCVGQKLHCTRLRKYGDEFISTSTVQWVQYAGDDIYYVITKNNAYIVFVR